MRVFHFSCEKILLQNSITVASRAVAAKSSISALEGLLFQVDEKRGVTVSGYNMNTGIQSDFPADIRGSGEVIVNARLLGDIIRRLPDDVVTMEIEDQLLHLTCGNARFDIPALFSDDYPELPKVDEEYTISMEQGILRNMIDEVSFSISTNESRPAQTGALFEIRDGQLTMVAVDGFRLALRKEILDDQGYSGRENFSFLVPGAALNEVKNICSDSDQPVVITLGKRHILFQTGGNRLICRRLEGEFLDYHSVIPHEAPISIKVETKALIASVDRVSAVNTDKLKSFIRCRFEQDRVCLSSKTGNGEAKDICPISGDGKNLEIGFNNRYLTDALRHAPAEVVRITLNNSVSSALILPEDDQDNFLYMVLPVRLRSVD